MPAPCGSGKKYKHLLPGKDRAAELAPAVRQRVALQAQEANRAALRKDYQAELLETETTLREAQALDARPTPWSTWFMPAASTRPNKPPESCWFATPEVHDGYDRLGMVHEARGQFARPPTATAR